jgi:hypothetical protein
MGAPHRREAGLITCRRARIHILDVEGLHDSSGECYHAVNEYSESSSDRLRDLNQRRRRKTHFIFSPAAYGRNRGVTPASSRATAAFAAGEINAFAQAWPRRQPFERLPD